MLECTVTAKKCTLTGFESWTEEKIVNVRAEC